MVEERTWYYVSLVHLILYIVTVFVNKYVLSVLSFQYPTIFQGWQTLVGVVLFKSLSLNGYVTLFPTLPSWRTVFSQLPLLGCYTISLYSGSKALAILPVPIFLACASITQCVTTAYRMCVQLKLIAVIDYLRTMLLVVTMVMVAETDDQIIHHFPGYYWITIHILTSGAASLLTKYSLDNTTLTDTQLLYCNYAFSVVVLAPSSVFLRDVIEVQKFPYFYLYRFYVGCVISGVCGALLNLVTIDMIKHDDVKLSYGLVSGRALACLLSLFCFEDKTSTATCFWVVMNIIVSFVDKPLLGTTKSVAQQLTPQKAPATAILQEL